LLLPVDEGVVVQPAPPDGDYVLRLRRLTATGPEIVATQAFRLVRSQP
jgi:hypothetical protein